MSGSRVLLQSSVGQSGPVGSSSSANFSLESRFMPVINQEYSLSAPTVAAAPGD